MQCICTLLVASLAVLFFGIASAVELVQLSDANRAILSLDTAKSLRIVQDAFKKDFKFDKVSQAKDFLNECKDLVAEMANASDDDFQGLAGKIKAVLAEPSINGACKVKRSKLDKFAILDEPTGESSYLSNKRLEAVKTLMAKIERHPHIKLIMGHLVDKTKNAMGAKLLMNAPEDTEIYFGELINDITYKKKCDISKVRPICNFARRTKEPKVSAIGADFADLKAVIESGDQAKLSSFAEASGVSLDDLKSACKSMEKDLYPIRMVNKYAKAQVISEQQISERCLANPDFNFYYQLSELCSTQQ